MPYYGPKSLNERGDTIYYTLAQEATSFTKLGESTELDSLGKSHTALISENEGLIDSSKSCIVIFINKQTESKLAGLLEFEKYKKEKLTNLPIYIIQGPSPIPIKITKNYYENYLKDSLGIHLENIFLRAIKGTTDDYEKIKAAYFLKKPIHVFDYFAVLIDKNRHIRGYYDPTYISEVKRMIEEYKHLVLKDEHANMQTTNKIEQK